MTVYKLTYFDLRGAAEAIRLIFHFLEIPFEDRRVKRDEWETLKPRTPQGKLPILEIDNGKAVIPQSFAIARFIAKKYGIAGKDEIEEAQVNSLADYIRDVQFDDFSSYMYVMQGYSEGDKVTLREESFMPAVNRVFPYLVNLLKTSNSGYFFPSGITWLISSLVNTSIKFDAMMLNALKIIQNSFNTLIVFMLFLNYKIT